MGKSKKPRVLTVAYMPGFACNLSCNYCYQRTDISHSRRKPILGKRPVSNEQISRFIHQFATTKKKQSIHLSLLGGEPLLYLDHFDRC
ncbi:radical SAM protein [Trueperella bernardiae]|uniref:radical SAM protein n=1 Tax=Trueperella bernardiae TaxID=59561 RepID=UPI0035CF1BEA